MHVLSVLIEPLPTQLSVSGRSWVYEHMDQGACPTKMVQGVCKAITLDNPPIQNSRTITCGGLHAAGRSSWPSYARSGSYEVLDIIGHNERQNMTLMCVTFISSLQNPYQFSLT